MKKRQFGATDMQVSILGFGGAEIGFGRSAVEEAQTILNQALDNGLNLIDTAECYAIGEELVGKAVSNRRGDYYLFTKCGHGGLRDELPAEVQDLDDWDPRLLRASIDRSLQRLQTDYVDLLQLHSCDEETLRRGEVIEVLQEARAAGKTRYIGYSGDNEPSRYAVECGAFDTLQTSCNIADQRCVDYTIALAQEKNMGVIAKRPLANVAWKYQDEPQESAYHHQYWKRLQVLDYPFTYGNLAQSVSIALRYTLTVPGVHTAIVGTAKPNRWVENARLLETGNLPREEYEAIRARWREVATPDWSGEV